jgi:hypothetical protein
MPDRVKSWKAARAFFIACGAIGAFLFMGYTAIIVHAYGPGGEKASLTAWDFVLVAIFTLAGGFAGSRAHVRRVKTEGLI